MKTKKIYNLKPKKITYVTTKDETTIEYEEVIKNKVIEKIYSFKGRLPVKNNEYDLIEFLKERLKNETF